MKAQKKIRVGMFGHYYPIYRKGVLEKLSSFDDIELVAYGTENFPAGLQLIKPNEVIFDLRNIRTILLKIPFTAKKISFQPASILKMLTQAHDVFIMPNTMSYADVWLNLFLSRLTGRRTCLWGHGFGSMRGRLATQIRKYFMKLADGIIFYTESELKRWSINGLPNEKLFVAPNALDTDASAKIRSTISDQDLMEFLHRQNLTGKKLIIFSGRLQERKNPILLINAMSQIIRNFPEAHAIIIGDGSLMNLIQKLVSDYGLDQHVSLKGAIFDERILAHYLMAGTVAVMPSKAGLFIQHAFDYGLPIVVGDDRQKHGPEIELVQDGITGLFFKDNNSESLAEKLMFLLSNDEVRHTMSLNAKKLIIDKYNKNNMAQGLLDAIRYAYTKGRAI